MDSISSIRPPLVLEKLGPNLIHCSLGPRSFHSKQDADPFSRQNISTKFGLWVDNDEATDDTFDKKWGPQEIK